MNRKSFLSIVWAILAQAAFAVHAAELTLSDAESLALDRDPGARGLIRQSRAFEDQAIADSQLPDPVLMAGWLNVPVDGNLDEEPMNQLRLSVKQMFPAGDTLEVRKQRALSDAGRIRQEAIARRLSVLQQTRNAWLEVHYWEAALEIVRAYEPMFEQLRDVTTSYYSTGRKGLADVVRSELELQRLRDREVQIEEHIDKQRAMLGRWLGSEQSGGTLPSDLPEIGIELAERAVLTGRLVEHPMVAAMDRRIDRLQQGVTLAKEQYKPDWSLELAYAFRDAERPNGVEVSDVASVVASVSLPFFTANRQDKQVSSASHQYNAGLDQRLDLLHALQSRLEAELARVDKLNDRIGLYETMILPQTRQQAQAALMAYKAEQSDFTEVMRSYISQLESTLEFERLQTDRLKAVSSLRYLIPPSDDLARASVDIAASGETHE